MIDVLVYISVMFNISMVIMFSIALMYIFHFKKTTTEKIKNLENKVNNLEKKISK
jgi:hypothetical protein